MCGRYALSLRPSEVRYHFQQSDMPVDDAPEDDDVRQTYNLAPGCHGLVYLANGSDHGGSQKQDQNEDNSPLHTKYKLQSMQWGLVPFWTKRNPDYGSKMKTINCRDDSLAEDRGMWTTMKKKKRCVIVAQGFYEWLKKNNGKEKIPHFTKRQDGQLMCFAGLWDRVQFEDATEPLFTYTIITTESNEQLGFLHDRMPVILDNGSDALRKWLDPNRTEWCNDLQSLLKPFDGKLECYLVSKEVGKVGNNSPSFVMPINSAENKSSIANFFANQQRKSAIVPPQTQTPSETSHIKVENDPDDYCDTTDHVGATENKAPHPVTALTQSEAAVDQKDVKCNEHKRKEEEEEADGVTAAVSPPQSKRSKPTSSVIALSPAKAKTQMQMQTPAAKKQGIRSATSNGGAARAPTRSSDGSRKITSFFSSK